MKTNPDSSDPARDEPDHLTHTPRRKAWIAASLAGAFGCSLISLALALAVILGEDPAVLTIPASDLPAFDESQLSLQIRDDTSSRDKLAELRIEPGASRRNIIVVDGQRETRAIEVKEDSSGRIVARSSNTPRRSLE